MREEKQYQTEIFIALLTVFFASLIRDNTVRSRKFIEKKAGEILQRNLPSEASIIKALIRGERILA